MHSSRHSHIRGLRGGTRRNKKNQQQGKDCFILSSHGDNSTVQKKILPLEFSQREDGISTRQKRFFLRLSLFTLPISFSTLQELHHS